MKGWEFVVSRVMIDSSRNLTYGGSLWKKTGEYLDTEWLLFINLHMDEQSEIKKNIGQGSLCL